MHCHGKNPVERAFNTSNTSKLFDLYIRLICLTLKLRFSSTSSGSRCEFLDGRLEKMDSFPVQLRDLVPKRFHARTFDHAQRELSKTTDATLAIFDRVIHLFESGETKQLGDIFNPDELAAKTKELLRNKKGQPSIQLLLPSTHFLATSHVLPDLPKESLISALRLQVEETLPSLERPIAIAFDSAKAQVESETLVLWHEQETLDKLFESFERQGLFLAIVKPRILALEFGGKSSVVLERDEISETLVVFENGQLKVWKQVHSKDLVQDALREQWEATISEFQTMRVHEVVNCQITKEFFSASGGSSFAFFPSGAIGAKKKMARSRRMGLTVALVIACLCIAASPFISQSIEFRSAARSLEAIRLMSQEARENQLAVVNFESKWGALNDFPDQQLRQAMFTLQNVLSPERISSMEVSEGLIKLQGASSDPQAILQRLEQDPLFTEVLFSRATSNTRYYIDLRLSLVNFEAYMVRYFPEG